MFRSPGREPRNAIRRRLSEACYRARSAYENCMSSPSLVIVGVLLAFTGSIHDSAAGAVSVNALPARECTPQFAPLTTGSSNSRSHLKFWRKKRSRAVGRRRLARVDV